MPVSGPPSRRSSPTDPVVQQVDRYRFRFDGREVDFTDIVEAATMVIELRIGGTTR